MKLWIAIMVLMFTAVGHAGKVEAGLYDGNELLERCESDSQSQVNMCRGFLAGIHDITGVYDAFGDMPKPFCVPEGVRLSQLQKVAIKGLNEEPETLHMDASSLIRLVFIEAFPCD